MIVAYNHLFRGIYRNIPFAIMGIIIITIFYNEAKHNDTAFRYMATSHYPLHSSSTMVCCTPIIGIPDDT